MQRRDVIFLWFVGTGWLFNALLMTKHCNFSGNFPFPISSHAAFFWVSAQLWRPNPLCFFCLKDIMRDSCQIDKIADKIAIDEYIYWLVFTYLGKIEVPKCKNCLYFSYLLFCPESLGFSKRDCKLWDKAKFRLVTRNRLLWLRYLFQEFDIILKISIFKPSCVW